MTPITHGETGGQRVGLRQRDRQPAEGATPGGRHRRGSRALAGDGADEVAEVADHELLRRCGEGDAMAWSLLVDRYQRLIFSVAIRNGLSREDAADVTQTTFMALLDSIDQIRGIDRLGSWLMTVARRQAWRLRRRAAQEQGGAAPQAESVDAVREWEELSWLHAGLSRLDPRCRHLLEALYFDPTEPSYAQIAERLGIAVGTVGPGRARCLARLQTILGEQEEDVHGTRR
jgi:RNA polymerase sigma factor (sigma-70 family)